MSNDIIKVRKRNRSLLIVEGYHEKNKLFWLIFKSFSELHISMDDIWIYGTNIYLLYEDIVKEYGPKWAEEKDDIDLPFVISKKQGFDTLCYKEDFTNIILVFDYERHDKHFSERKIIEMQERFEDAADMGKLYINYPMIESYQHLKSLPDNDYFERKIPVSLQPGKKYKALADNETVIKEAVEFPHKIDDLLNKRFGVQDKKIRNECCNAVLNNPNEIEIDSKLQEILAGIIEEREQKTLRYQLRDCLTKLGYIHIGQTYWEYIRQIFKEIIYHNICKANWIQNSQCKIIKEKYKECFERLDLVKILKTQNIFSRDVDTGYIWVLSTCVFFVAEYNFSLVTK